jgi:hypothetical protein
MWVGVFKNPLVIQNHAAGFCLRPLNIAIAVLMIYVKRSNVRKAATTTNVSE